MSETKFTPGPWTVRDHGKDRNNDSNIYVHVGGEKNYGNPIAKVVMGGHGALNSENDSLIANAKLISVAPDMYDIVKELYDWAQDTQVFGPIYPKLEAVMNKLK